MSCSYFARRVSACHAQKGYYIQQSVDRRIVTQELKFAGLVPPITMHIVGIAAVTLSRQCFCPYPADLATLLMNIQAAISARGPRVECFNGPVQTRF